MMTLMPSLRTFVFTAVLVVAALAGVSLPTTAEAKWYGQAESYNGKYLAVIRNTNSDEFDVVGGPYKNKKKANRKADKAAKKANKQEAEGVKWDPECDDPTFNC